MTDEILGTTFHSWTALQDNTDESRLSRAVASLPLEPCVKAGATRKD